MSFAPSQYQQRIFDFVTNGKGSGLIEAVAGSGKTTTIVKALDLIPSDQKVLFLAFNKSIAEELKSRVPAHVEARTLNSLGFGAVMRAANGSGRPQIDGHKVRKFMREMLPPAAESYAGDIARLVGLCKANGMVPASFGASPLIPFGIDAVLDVADAFDMNFNGDGETVARWVGDLLAANNVQRDVLDFDDQLLFPVIYNLTLYRFDWVFVDEAQDLSLVQRALVKKALKPGGRLVAVGDSRQAIYAFRGADSGSMARIERDFNCTRLPLSISYRCAKSVVEEAQRYVPHIEASETAPDGSVRHLNEFGPDTFEVNDLIVCRNTAPLVEMAYRLMSARKPCRILGRDIGEVLKALIKKLKPKGIDGLLKKLLEWEEKEVERLMARDKTAQAEHVRDKAECIRFLANLADTVPQLLADIDSLFSGAGTTLATVHKSKGLEAGRVFILNAGLMPSKYARTAEAMTQEINLIYVAVTRAKRELVYIESENYVVNA